MASNVLAKMAVLISAQTAEFNKALQNSSSQLKSFGNAAANINKTLAAFGIGFGIYEVARGIKSAIGVMADFEATMSEVKAITGATGNEFERLRDDALRLGASTKYTATQVGQLQIAYGRLGFTTKEILAATEATLNLAAATGEDLAKAADVAGSTVRGFGLNAKETGRVVDVMASSFNKTALGLDNFTESMKYVAPVANAAGATVEETTALLGVLADAGIRGSQAGTSLRKIFTDLTKDGRPLSERLAELAAKGITLQDSMDEVGRTAQTSLLVLSKNTAKTAELAAAFKNAGGEAAAMARIMQDNLTGDVTKLTSAFEGLILKLSDSKILRDFTKGLTAIINALASVPDAEGLLDTIAGRFPKDRLLPDVVAEDFIKKLGDIRREAGRPIDTKAVEALATSYNLSSEQANQLYRMVLQANEALSFQEKAVKQFTDFASRNGYQDLTKAADDYKQKLYELILAEEIKKRQLEDVNIDGTFNDSIKGIDEQIAAYRRVIRIVNEYSAGLEPVAAAESAVAEAQAPVVKNLEYYRDALKKVNEEYDKTDATNLSRLRILASTAAGYEDVIKRLEKLRSLGNVQVGIQMNIDSGELNKQVPTADQLTARLQATMDSYIAKTTEFKNKIVELDLSGALTNSISSGITSVADALGSAAVGVGNFGESILKAIGAFARQMGEAMIAMGTAALAAKLLIKNPAVAIGAGVALVALASALNASMSSAQKNFNGGGGGGSNLSQPTAINYTTGNQMELQVVPGEFKIEGQTLVAVVTAQQRRDGRNRG